MRMPLLMRYPKEIKQGTIIDDIVEENGSAVAVNDKYPVTPGHVLVRPQQVGRARCGVVAIRQQACTVLEVAAHHQHLRLYRTLPDLTDELGALVKARHDPLTSDHWRQTDSVQWSAWLSHRIKTLYAFRSLLRVVDDAPTRRRAEEAFLYLMA